MRACPTPHKHQHRTEAGAVRQLDSVVAAGKSEPGSMEVYPCACGHWHIGHRTKPFTITFRLFGARTGTSTEIKRG